MAKAQMRDIKYNYKQRAMYCDGQPMDIIQATENFCLFNEFAQRNGVNYFMLYGSALGVYRDNGFIPHDEDIDLGVNEEDFFVIFSKLNELALCGFLLVRFEPRGLLSLMRGTEYIDVFCIKGNGEKVIICDMYIYPARFFFEATTIAFLGFSVQLPSEIEEYLLYEYGESWNIPIKYEPSKRAIYFSRIKEWAKRVLPSPIKNFIIKQKSKKYRSIYLEKYSKYISAHEGMRT